MQYFSVKGFSEFQHYKDRSPPWIKLYNKLLDDYEFGALPDASKAHLIAIWLLASRYENRIPYDPKWIARRINATEDVDLIALSETGFILVEHDCSETLAERKQTAIPERETEGETEKEPPSVSAPCAPSPPVDLKSQIFGPCLGWLAKQSGKSSQSLRSAVGRWCRDYGDGPVVEAMLAAQRASPVEPVAYIERLLKSGGPRDGPHSRERQAALDAQVDQMISDAAERADAQQSQAYYGPVDKAESGIRAAHAEDDWQRAEPEVRGAGRGLRRIASAFPAVGAGGGR